MTAAVDTHPRQRDRLLVTHRPPPIHSPRPRLPGDTVRTLACERGLCPGEELWGSSGAAGIPTHFLKGEAYLSAEWENLGEIKKDKRSSNGGRWLHGYHFENVILCPYHAFALLRPGQWGSTDKSNTH